jgi:two-component system response regulator
MPLASEVEVLLVEDTPEDAELMLRALKKGHLTNHCHHVEDGAAALDFLFREGEYADRVHENPKVVLLDLKLPKVDGIEVLRRIKQDVRTKCIPVVVLTSSRESKDLASAYKLGVNSYIVKPVDFDQFTDAVQKLGHYWKGMNVVPDDVT